MAEGASVILSAIFRLYQDIQQRIHTMRVNQFEFVFLMERCAALIQPMQGLQNDPSKLVGKEKALKNVEIIFQYIYHFSQLKRFHETGFLAKLEKAYYAFDDAATLKDLSEKLTTVSQDLGLVLQIHTTIGLNEIKESRAQIVKESLEFLGKEDLLEDQTATIETIKATIEEGIESYTNLSMVLDGKIDMDVKPTDTTAAITIANSDNGNVVAVSTAPQLPPTPPTPPTRLSTSFFTRLFSGSNKSTKPASKREEQAKNQQEEPTIKGERDSSKATVTASTTASGTIPQSLEKKAVLHSIQLTRLEFNEHKDKLIGQGSFGEVFASQYKNQPVAVKRLPGTLHQVKDPTLLRSLKREALIMQYVSHPNIVGFFGASMEKGLLLLELADCSLDDALYGDMLFQRVVICH